MTTLASFFPLKDIDGQACNPLLAFRGKALILVNTASK